jgi:hypothetical protein
MTEFKDEVLVSCGPVSVRVPPQTVSRKQLTVQLKVNTVYSKFITESGMGKTKKNLPSGETTVIRMKSVGLCRRDGTTRDR